MSDRELLTECLDVLTHDAAQRTFAGGVRMSQLSIKLRTALAAPRPEPEPTHPGYILGSHWLETAYSRICAGEAEADVLKDCGWERVTDADALRRDAEQGRWLRDWLDNNGLLVRAIRGESLAGYKHPDIEALRRDGLDDKIINLSLGRMLDRWPPVGGQDMSDRKAMKLRSANDLEAFYRLTGEGGMDAQAAAELLCEHAEIERLKADNERLRGLLAEAQKAVWMNYDGDLLDRIEAALREVPR